MTLVQLFGTGIICGLVAAIIVTRKLQDGENFSNRFNGARFFGRDSLRHQGRRKDDRLLNCRRRPHACRNMVIGDLQWQ